MTYVTIDRIFEQNDASIGAAEAHGIAAGILCVEGQATCDQWLAEVFEGEVDLSDDDRTILGSLFEQTGKLLDSGDFDFDLLLPDEDAPLKTRTEALRDWCQGFLLGIGYAGSSIEWPGDSGNILKDIVEFTRIDPEVDGEEDETALTELNEYIRVGVQLLRSELLDKSVSGTLH